MRSGASIPWQHHLLMPHRSRLFFDFPFTVIVVPETGFIIILYSRGFFCPLWLHTENWLLIRTLFKNPLVSNSSEAWEGNLIFTLPVPQATLWGTRGKEAVCGFQLSSLLALVMQKKRDELWMNAAFCWAYSHRLMLPLRPGHCRFSWLWVSYIECIAL